MRACEYCKREKCKKQKRKNFDLKDVAVGGAHTMIDVVQCSAALAPISFCLLIPPIIYSMFLMAFPYSHLPTTALIWCFLSIFNFFFLKLLI